MENNTILLILEFFDFELVDFMNFALINRKWNITIKRK